ncbi:MAG TPA: LysM peptidoglycan-binding domain-containing protein [Oscillospiraceae bacterium]|nr:LysM peptidoglycan-binding domain-containing protein [Oscillospiraceae bacterium]
MKTLATYRYQRQQSLCKQQKFIRTALVLLVLTIVIGITFVNNNVALGETRLPQDIVVETGDTLWTLAQRYAPQRMDIRKYVRIIMEHNELTGPLVYPGQLLELP